MFIARGLAPLLPRIGHLFSIQQEIRSVERGIGHIAALLDQALISVGPLKSEFVQRFNPHYF